MNSGISTLKSNQAGTGPCPLAVRRCAGKAAAPGSLIGDPARAVASLVQSCQPA